MLYILENASKRFPKVREVFRKKLFLRNFINFQKERGQAFQNQTNSRKFVY